MTGDVIRYLRDRSYGFIAPQDNPRAPELFFHKLALLDQEKLPLAGDAVEYELSEHKHRPCAIRVRITKFAESVTPTGVSDDRN